MQPTAVEQSLRRNHVGPPIRQSVDFDLTCARSLFWFDPLREEPRDGIVIARDQTGEVITNAEHVYVVPDNSFNRCYDKQN